jgi:isocitrate lyase
MWTSGRKVTVPHEDFLAKINAIRYAFFRIRSWQGVIVAELILKELVLLKSYL